MTKETFAGGVGVGGVGVVVAVWKMNTIVVEGVILAAKIVIIVGVEVVSAALVIDTTMIMHVEGDRAAIAIDTTVLVACLHQLDMVEDCRVTRLQLHLLWLQSALAIFFILSEYLSILCYSASG
jgi:hypothetical protein